MTTSSSLPEPYTTISDVFKQPLRIRDRGLIAKYSDRLMKDGEVYKRVAEDVIPELCDKLNEHMGRPIRLEAMGWRLNYAAELPNRAIHSDSGWGTHACVVYMDPTPPEGNGTAFWKHKPTGSTTASINDVTTYFAMMGDWDDTDKFEKVALAPAVFNTATVYKGENLHSRWPFEAYGDSPQNGRLCLVAFFS